MRVLVELIEKDEGGWLARIEHSHFRIQRVVGEAPSMDEALGIALHRAQTELIRANFMKLVIEATREV